MTNTPTGTYTPTSTITPTVTATLTPQATRTPIPPEQFDLNSDGIINGLDILVFIELFNSDIYGATGDFNKDSKVDSSDLFLLSENWKE